MNTPAHVYFTHRRLARCVRDFATPENRPLCHACKLLWALSVFRSVAPSVLSGFDNVAAWTREPDGLGSNPGPASYWYRSRHQVVPSLRGSVPQCRMGLIVVSVS